MEENRNRAGKWRKREDVEGVKWVRMKFNGKLRSFGLLK